MTNAVAACKKHEWSVEPYAAATQIAKLYVPVHGLARPLSHRASRDVVLSDNRGRKSSAVRYRSAKRVERHDGGRPVAGRSCGGCQTVVNVKRRPSTDSLTMRCICVVLVLAVASAYLC